jgi:hypothetical protein
MTKYRIFISFCTTLDRSNISFSIHEFNYLIKIWHLPSRTYYRAHVHYYCYCTSSFLKETILVSYTGNNGSDAHGRYHIRIDTSPNAHVHLFTCRVTWKSKCRKQITCAAAATSLPYTSEFIPRFIGVPHERKARLSAPWISRDQKTCIVLTMLRTDDRRNHEGILRCGVLNSISPKF